jgi:hypothetical protein
MCEYALHTRVTTASGDTNSKQMRSEQYIVSAVAMARAYKTKQQQQQQQQKVSVNHTSRTMCKVCICISSFALFNYSNVHRTFEALL